LLLGGVRLVVGEPGGGVGGRAYTFGDYGTKLISQLTYLDPGAQFGWSVSLAGYHAANCGENFDQYDCRILIGAPEEGGRGTVLPMSCVFPSGEVRGAPRYQSQIGERYGQAVPQLDTYTDCPDRWSGPAEARSAPRYDDAAAVDAGAVEVSLPDALWETTYAPVPPRSAMFTALHPQPQADARFGSAIAFVRDLLDWYPMRGGIMRAVAIGAPRQDVGSPSDQGLVYFFNIYGDVLRTVASPNPQAGAHFGSAMTPLSTLGINDDYLAVSAPDEDVNGLSGQGRVYLFETSTISKTDTDRDGLFDAWETILGTRPDRSDTDGDGVSDWEEVYVYKTDPLNAPR
jgi:hypothetical protein